MKHKRNMGLMLLLGLWLALAVWAWCKPADAISLSERRSLSQFPALSAGAITSGDFMEDFSSYTVDQFPARDFFRGVKAVAANAFFRLKDNNNIYIAGDCAVQMEYALDEASVEYACARFNELYEMYLDESEQVIFSIVPDKGYYLGKPSGHLTMDYDVMFDTMRRNLPWARFVDITDCLSADCYYRTDTHWRQENLFPVAQRLAQALEISAPSSGLYSQETVTDDFRGVYYGQAALPLEPDVLRVLSWPGWENCTVYTQDTGKTTRIYDMDKLASNDLYNIFLSGGAALQTVENPNAQNDRELIVFRDSFGSSLIPLLVSEYSTVTVIDTRYISPQLLGDYVNFQGKTVLMLYSTLVLNSSGTLRK